MAYWIVYQGNSWKRARSGGYLWAPKENEHGQTRQYWKNMAQVQPGDLIFSGVDNAVRAVSQAAVPAYDAIQPDQKDAKFWQAEGWRLDVAYTDLPSPLFYADWVPQIVTELPSIHSPFDRNREPVQGYLYGLPLSVGEYLVTLIRQNGIEIETKANDEAPLPAGGETERDVLAKSRVGQGKFRDDLLKRWNHRCALSGVDRAELLRASHIKPWSGSNNDERLDPCNRILLSSIYDAAFDAKLISFSDSGEMIVAEDFSAEQLAAAGINSCLKLEPLSEGNRRYLVDHRVLLAARVQRLAQG